MISTAKALRRSLYAVFAASAAGGASVAALMGNPAPSATAATDPCAASELAKTIGSVATSTGTYLDSHPETNQALTTISQQQAGPQSLGAIKTYFDANPQVAKDMQQLQQPLVTPVHPLQAAGQPAPADGPDAGRAATGRRPAGGFARSAADGAGDGRSRRRAARFAVACIGRHAGQRTASRPSSDHHPLAPGDPRSAHVTFGFRTFLRLVKRKARKSAPFLLSF